MERVRTNRTLIICSHRREAESLISDFIHRHCPVNWKHSFINMEVWLPNGRSVRWITFDQADRSLYGQRCVITLTDYCRREHFYSIKYREIEEHIHKINERYVHE